MRDRRQERRQRTIDEVVTTALDVMAETGAAGLSLGAVAKRMGMRTPSLYGYFESKAALCDEIFARGWREVSREKQRSGDDSSTEDDAAARLLNELTRFIGWALDHRAQAELMFWRPVPGWEPSAQAYDAAVSHVDTLRAELVDMQRQGLLRADAPVEQMVRVITVLASGVISQQLSNQPGTPLAEGRFAGDLPTLVAMFLHEYGPGETPLTTRSDSTRKKARR